MRWVHAAGGNCVPRGDRTRRRGGRPAAPPNHPQGHSRVPSFTLADDALHVGQRKCRESAPERIHEPGLDAAQRASSALAFVEAALRLLETFGDDDLDGIGRARDDPVPILVRVERREHEVRDIARIAAAGPSDTDTQAQELGRTEHLRDRAKPVVPRQAAARACLQAAELEIDVVVHDEHIAGSTL